MLNPLLVELHDAADQGASNSGFINTAVFIDYKHNETLSGQTGNPLLDFDQPASQLWFVVCSLLTLQWLQMMKEKTVRHV